MFAKARPNLGSGVDLDPLAAALQLQGAKAFDESWKKLIAADANALSDLLGQIVCSTCHEDGASNSDIAEKYRSSP